MDTSKGCVRCGEPLSYAHIFRCEVTGDRYPACERCLGAVIEEFEGGLPWWPADWHGHWFRAGRLWQYRTNGKIE